MTSLIATPQIQSATLHTPTPFLLHTYIWPFIGLWPAFFAIYLSPTNYTKYIDGQEWTFVFSGTIFTLQSLLWLMTFWSVNIRALFTARSVTSISEAKLIKVIPAENAGASEICTLHRDTQGVWFLFQKRKFLLKEGRFAPLEFDIDADPKPRVGGLQGSRGLNAKEVKQREDYYGMNVFDIPIPTFSELFKEHAVAPFFVFQVFCVGLWMLDEYWYYSLFTLLMLVVFESTVVWQRQRTLKEFRGMSIKPYEVWVSREGKWMEIMSDALLPGDLASVGRTKEDSGVACDMILVEGSAIVNEAMLSGESTPVLKDSIQLRPSEARLEPEGIDKNAFLWGGTKVLQTQHVAESSAKTMVPPPPDGGCLAVVTKTGFETNQGALVRTMIYSTERVSANNLEALLFILFLCVFAIAASWYVWVEGVKMDRKRSKLLLDCVLIITSVVPPELPMELSLAVNTSLAALSKFAIFCTEPFRIPFAGRVDVACFDKTGTLTGEDLLVDGIAGLSLGKDDVKTEPDGAQSQLKKVAEVGLESTLTLATAHALVRLDEGDIVGEPMEKATLEALGWSLEKENVLTSQVKGPNSVQIKRRFQFSSALKRQSSVATAYSGQKATGTFVGAKGAPETIQKMLVAVPPKYEETFKYFSRNGARVLALGYKYLKQGEELKQSKINDLKREDVEKDLHFAGFLVLQCPLKDDALKAVRMLNESSHRVVMITGDNPLTAVHVARQVEIVDRDTLILDAPENDDSGEKVVWRSIDDKTSIPVDPEGDIDPDILQTKDLCVTGYGLAKFKGKKGLKSLLRYTWVYARVSPKQKEEILLGLKEMGYTTLMAGDGTNDVGALKQAHVGVALLNGTQDDLDKIAKHFRETKMKEIYEKQCAMMERFNQPKPPVPPAIAHLFPAGPTNPHHAKAVERELNSQGGGSTSVQASGNFAEKLQQSMMEDELNSNDPPTIKLGDASVAAPFTSKLSNVIAIPNIIRQGRCTLVATIQMYKILALNCLISAYSLSVLYLDGIKFGDGQVTISGILMSVCFLSISRARPVEKLSAERPQNNIWNWYIIPSVLGQFAIHMVTLIYISTYVHAVMPPRQVIDLDGTFEPSLLNSAIYLLQLIQQISTFAINYQGRPFREGLSENKGMYYGLLLTSAVAFSCATEFVPELNKQLKLVEFDMPFKARLTAAMVLDYVLCWGVERVLKNTFGVKAKDIAIRRPEQIERERVREKGE
ncbi:E1-E2 ATPase family protein [Piedraia hortae CBS 480.64]|uniref:E1-E2 ATPase family protein n=1 Tax=Piedraia hortae CBS 480.64 TaxID=1314780 RepID=A0A6A7BZ08_9PEZI|nr:E1-E2 ATPase family protein [Piedraia hortae CBS 480.64]